MNDEINALYKQYFNCCRVEIAAAILTLTDVLSTGPAVSNAVETIQMLCEQQKQENHP